ncbi:MAG: J domain-containing protein [Cytophagales bacterium]|nr:MAG: J domain-containing protein [Cytophagales bacterium]TAF61513.1 MAG: J domain-containing protein [Cytophagales bacterium]
MSATFYKILELKDFASIAEVKRAFKRLSLKYHPDLNPNDKTAEERFKQINEAYSVLSNETSKNSYDARLNSLTNNFIDYYKQQAQNYQQYQAEQKRRADILAKAEKERFANSRLNIVVSFLSIVGVCYLLIATNSIFSLVSRIKYYQAVQYEAKGQYKAAWEVANQSLFYDERYADGHALVAKILFKNSNPTASLYQSIASAFAYRTSKHLECLEMRIFTNLSLDSSRLAIKDYALLLKLMPNAAVKATQILDSLWLNTRRYNEIAQIADICIKYNPNSPDAYLIASLSYSFIGKDDLAKARFARYQQYGKPNPERLHTMLQNAYYTKQQLAISLILASALLDQPSNNYRQTALCVRAHAYRDSRQYKNAFKDYDAAVKENPLSDSLHYFRALAYLDLGLADSACRDWDRAFRLGFKGRNTTLEYFCTD